ncbi:PAS domain-containing sensor histidine kinase, partial [Deferrisoma sp.]
MGFFGDPSGRRAVLAGAAFLGAGAAWLLVSDRWVADLGLDPEGFLRFRRIEAGVLVVAAAGAVAWVVGRLLREEARRQAEVERREARYRTLFEMAPVALWEEDASELLDRMEELRIEGGDLASRLRKEPELLADLAARVRVLDVNRRALELYGARRKEELLGSLDQVLTPSGLAAFGEAVKAVERGETAFEMEAENRTLRGRPLRVLLRFWVSAEGPDRGRALVSVTDLTELHRAREDLQRLAALAEESPGPVLSFDREGRVLWANAAARRLAEEFGAPGPEGLLPPEAPEVIRRAAATGRPVLRQEVERAGRWVSWNALPVAGGRWVHVFGGEVTDLVRAREERGRLEARLRETERLEALGRFAAGIAHDFNNLHMVIQGNAELGLLEPGLPDRTRKGLERIVAASGRAADLVAKLLAYSGIQRSEPEPVDLGRVVAGVLEDLGELVPDGVKVQRDDRPGAPAAWIDPGQARIVVQNLVTNAVEAVAPAGGRVTVRTSALEDPAGWFGEAEGEPPDPGRRYVLLEVADTGPGMDEETRRRAFDPFFTTKFLGRGLGLSVVWGVARAVGGAVRIDSAPGRGTRVGVALP